MKNQNFFFQIMVSHTQFYTRIIFFYPLCTFVEEVAFLNWSMKKKLESSRCQSLLLLTRFRFESCFIQSLNYKALKCKHCIMKFWKADTEMIRIIYNTHNSDCDFQYSKEVTFYSTSIVIRHTVQQALTIFHT